MHPPLGNLIHKLYVKCFAVFPVSVPLMAERTLSTLIQLHFFISWGGRVANDLSFNFLFEYIKMCCNKPYLLSQQIVVDRTIFYSWLTYKPKNLQISAELPLKCVVPRSVQNTCSLIKFQRLLAKMYHCLSTNLEIHNFFFLFCLVFFFFIGREFSEIPHEILSFVAMCLQHVNPS